MTDSYPGVEDEVERALRLGLATAAQMADRLARARQDLARQAQHRSEQEARQLEARFRGEGAAATARLTVVDRREWWNHADPEQIAGMYELAAQWSADQSGAAGAIETIAMQVRDRYGIDLHAPGADPVDVRAALARIDLDRVETSAQRSSQGDDAADAVSAVVRAEQRDAALAVPEGATSAVPGAAALLEQSDEYGQDAASAAGVPDRAQEAVPYDSAIRRNQTESILRESGIPEELVAVAMRADVAQARSAAEAAALGSQPDRARGMRRGVARGVNRPDRVR